MFQSFSIGEEDWKEKVVERNWERSPAKDAAHLEERTYALTILQGANRKPNTKGRVRMYDIEMYGRKVGHEILGMPLDKEGHLNRLKYFLIEGIKGTVQIGTLKKALTILEVADGHKLVKELDVLYKMHNSEVRHYLSEPEKCKIGDMYFVPEEFFKYSVRQKEILHEIREKMSNTPGKKARSNDTRTEDVVKKEKKRMPSDSYIQSKPRKATIGPTSPRRAYNPPPSEPRDMFGKTSSQHNQDLKDAVKVVIFTILGLPVMLLLMYGCAVSMAP